MSKEKIKEKVRQKINEQSAQMSYNDAVRFIEKEQNRRAAESAGRDSGVMDLMLMTAKIFGVSQGKVIKDVENLEYDKRTGKRYGDVPPEEDL